MIRRVMICSVATGGMLAAHLPFIPSVWLDAILIFTLETIFPSKHTQKKGTTH